MVDGFFRRWKKGIETLSPLYLLRVKRGGYVGQLVGLLLVIIVMLFSGFGYWVLFMFFVGVIVFVELLGVHQQIKEVERFGGW